MNWLNLNTSVLDSPEFVGGSPVERATWLCLLRYCAGQENGGRIVGCRAWKDRQWQQLIRVTLREATTVSGLWEWDGDDIIVHHYPSEKEAEVQEMRNLGRAKTERKADAARENGNKGGRPKTQRETQRETEQETQREETQHNPTETHRKEVEEERKEKGKEVPAARQKPTAEIGEDEGRHHAITSRIGAVYAEITGKPYSFNGRFVKALQSFLAGWSGSAQQWLDTYADVLTYSARPFARKTVDACDPAILCRDWNAVEAELDKLKADEAREQKAPRTPFTKSI